MCETVNGGYKNMFWLVALTESGWGHVGTDSYSTALLLGKSPVDSWLVSSADPFEAKYPRKKEARFYLATVCIITKRTCYQLSFRGAWCLDSKDVCVCVWGGGGGGGGARGRSTVPRMSCIVLSLICALMFSCLVSHNKAVWSLFL